MLWILRLAIGVKWVGLLTYLFTIFIGVIALTDKSPKNAEFMQHFLPWLLGFHFGSVGTFFLMEWFGLRWCCQMTAASLRQKLIALESSLSADHPRRAAVQQVMEQARVYTNPPGWAPFGRTYEDLVEYLEKGYGHLREARRIARS